MSDRLIQVIDEIRAQAIGFHQQYVAERSKNETLEAEVKALQQKISDESAKISSLASKVSSLEVELKAAEDREVKVVKDNGLSDAEIDDLVKEIEYCIERLKQ